MFQLDDSKSLHETRCFTKHPLKNGCLGCQVWVLGNSIPGSLSRRGSGEVSFQSEERGRLCFWVGDAQNAQVPRKAIEGHGIWKPEKRGEKNGEIGGGWWLLKVGYINWRFFYFIFILDIIKDNFMTCGFWLMFVFFKFCHEMLWKKTDCRTVVHSFQKDACKLTYPPGNPASICWNVHFWRCWFSKELPMNGGSHV